VATPPAEGALHSALEGPRGRQRRGCPRAGPLVLLPGRHGRLTRGLEPEGWSGHAVTRNMPEPNTGPFLLGRWSASAPWCQRRSCSLGRACSRDSCHALAGVPGPRNNLSLGGAQRAAAVSLIHAPMQPDQEDEEAAAPGVVSAFGRAATGFTPRRHARFLRPAEALLPNSPSCGIQPANICVTAPSRPGTHASSSTGSGHRSGARKAIRAPLGPAPLTTPPYMSVR
jgi:hypothetical protein